MLSKLVFSVTLLTCIPKPTRSDLGKDMGCFYRGFLGCLHFPTGKFRNRSADLQLGHSGFLADPSKIIIILQQEFFFRILIPRCLSSSFIFYGISYFHRYHFFPPSEYEKRTTFVSRHYII